MTMPPETGHRPPSADPPEADATPAGPADDPVAEAAREVDELERVAAERDEYLDALRRMKADFENYRRRTERERPVLAQSGVRDLVAELLPVVDNLERAVEAMGAQGAVQAEGIVAGVEMVRQQLGSLLTGRGVEEIDAHGREFDPQVHEAVYRTPSDEHPEGTVVAVTERGYRMNEAVIRPAKVVVSGGASEEG